MKAALTAIVDLEGSMEDLSSCDKGYKRHKTSLFLELLNYAVAEFEDASWAIHDTNDSPLNPTIVINLDA